MNLIEKEKVLNLLKTHIDNNSGESLKVYREGLITARDLISALLAAEEVERWISEEKIATLWDKVEQWQHIQDAISDWLTDAGLGKEPK